MKENSLSEIIKFLPQNKREYAKRQLDIANEEIYNYIYKNKIQINDEQKEIIRLSILVNLIDEHFVKSLQNYQRALNYIKEYGVIGFQVGTRRFSHSDEIVIKWEKFVNEFKWVKIKLQKSGFLLLSKSIPEMIKTIVRND